MTDGPDTSGLYLGDRIVIRHRVGARQLTDVTGLLIDAGDPLIVDGTGPKNRGDRRSIPHADVTSLRVLSFRPVRNSEIRALTQVIAERTPGRTETIDGWLLRAECSAPLDNSALPIGVDARADGPSLAMIARWYAERGLPAIVGLPDRLIPDARVVGPPVGPLMHVLVKPDDVTTAIVADSTERGLGESLRAAGHRLHHALRHVGIDTYGDA